MPIIDEVRDRLDIIDVVGGYIKLGKSGANYKGLCPFHKEKTPSFMVSPERQIWHCFGCGEGGDIFKFVMKYENLDFPEALRLLAKQAGVEVKKEDPQIRNEMLKLYEICEQAAEYFEMQLKENSSAQEYLKKRGLQFATIKFWQLGFASADNDGLYRYLVKKGFKVDDIVKIGLVLKSTLRPNSYFDRFRDRVIFPIFDGQDRIAGFTGRIFNEARHPNEPKYLNSPESPIFNKGRILYGFSKNKKDIREKDQVILVEGQMDFLMAWQNGIKNIVATSGTALTSEQLKNLRRMTKVLVVGYDMDQAGRIATERAIDLAKVADFKVKVISLPDGFKDIADFVLAQPEDLENLMERAEDSGDYYYRIAMTDINLSSVDDKKRAARFLLSKIKYLSNAIERSHWLTKVANDLQIKETYLEEELDKLKLENKKLSNSNVTIESNTKIFRPRREILYERILALAVKDETIRPRLEECKGYFSDEYLILSETIISNRLFDLEDKSIEDRLGYLKLLADYEFDQEFDIIGEFERATRELRKEFLKDLILKKSLSIKEAEKNNDPEQLGVNLNEFRELLKELSNF